PAVLAGSAGVIACFAIFYLATAFALGHMTNARGYAREDILLVQLAANCFLALGIVISAIWSDATSPRRVLMAGAMGTVLLGLVFGQALAGASLFVVFLVLAL